MDSRPRSPVDTARYIIDMTDDKIGEMQTLLENAERSAQVKLEALEAEVVAARRLQQDIELNASAQVAEAKRMLQQQARASPPGARTIASRGAQRPPKE